MGLKPFKSNNTVLLGITLFIVLASIFYAKDIQSATAYMEFVISEIQGDRVTAENSNGYSFVFEKPGFKVKVGMRVVVRTDLKYLGEDTWKWDTNETSIIGREKDKWFPLEWNQSGLFLDKKNDSIMNSSIKSVLNSLFFWRKKSQNHETLMALKGRLCIHKEREMIYLGKIVNNSLQWTELVEGNTTEITIIDVVFPSISSEPVKKSIINNF